MIDDRANDEHPSWRKPVGALAIMALIVMWCALVVSFAPIVGAWHWSAQLAFYAVTGIVWITPTKPLLRWMETGRFR